MPPSTDDKVRTDDPAKAGLPSPLLRKSHRRAMPLTAGAVFFVLLALVAWYANRQNAAPMPVAAEEPASKQVPAPAPAPGSSPAPIAKPAEPGR